MNTWQADPHTIRCHMEIVPSSPLEERILNALNPLGIIKTFDQINMSCGGLDPDNFASPEEFSQRLDKALQGLIAVGKVRLVAKRPVLCFTLGTILDRIVREIDLSD
jgi:hypothetical protein